MLDTTIHPKSLERQLRRSDFARRTPQEDILFKEAILAEAMQIAADGFDIAHLQVSQIHGKPVYQHAKLSQALLIRHASQNIRKLTGVKQSDRQSIIKSLISLLREGVAFTVMKIDIKSFYESISTAHVLDSLRNDPAFSRQSVFVLDSFFDALRRRGIQGLPRGIGLSATLAEFAMRNFDQNISNVAGVRFYSRYVDDAILVITDNANPAEIRALMKRYLPPNLDFNQKKTKNFDFERFNRTDTDRVEHVVEFLGYAISVGKITRKNQIFSRTVEVDISGKKVAKIKRRLAKALIEFNDGGSFDDLLDRVKILTSNYEFTDNDSGQKRYSGLRYSYPHINAEASRSLTTLDKFFVHAIVSKKTSNRLRPNLSEDQLKKLLGFRFMRGYNHNVFFSFNIKRFEKLVGCWSHA
ncbi:antiviral reverse transcriptase Drt3a [Rhizosaccharibacter radicis]|uniref:RNA-directed DNA polymerase n=1 Tax=Rhizosaccharibacter radicis TaxID=2782605 RepID=A0ABT1VVW2_9PROT|nr:RNA-directed DNA polymerase [Acetobacteraceae bacterium KSS12]